MKRAVALLSHPAITALRRPGRYDRAARARLRRLAPQVMPAEAAAATPAAWRTRTFSFTSTSVAVAQIDAGTGSDRYVVKMPYTAEGNDSLRRQASTLATLHGDERLRDLRPVIPCCVAQGSVDGQRFWVERRLPGAPVTRRMLCGPDGRAVLDHATRIATDLHARTSRRVVADAGVVATWVNRPLDRVRGQAGLAADSEIEERLRLLRAELTASLLGRSPYVGWIHGDFWPGNLMACGPAVSGVVDWDQAQPDQLLLHDMLHLHLFAQRMLDRRELGDIIVAALHHGIAKEIAVPVDTLAGWLDGLPERTALLLYWARHVSLFIGSPGHGDDHRWLDRNVRRVLSNAYASTERQLSGSLDLIGG